MPEMHLVSTVLPAPLSPTRAMTWPRVARRFAPVSALTAPKCLNTPLASSRFSSLTCSTLALFALGGSPAGRRGAPPNGSAYLMPYFVQSAAYDPVQIWAGVRNPSLITVCSMFDAVTGTGVSSTAGVVLPGPFATVALVVGGVPLTSAMASFEAASDSFLTAL